jgi:dTDP-4-dehydrorhamnose 3,5-epimerase
MKFAPMALPDVVLIDPQVHGDERGFFMETWHRARFAAAGITADFVQDNYSVSRRGTLRGLHYQLRHTQGKLVRVMFGEVFDVAVDVRRSSASFGGWVGAHLSAANKQCMWIPPGFAHGFLVLSETADFHYKCTDYYDPDSEHAIRWDDPAIGIQWPLSPDVPLLVSPKDRAARALSDAETLP